MVRSGAGSARADRHDARTTLESPRTVSAFVSSPVLFIAIALGLLLVLALAFTSVWVEPAAEQRARSLSFATVFVSGIGFLGVLFHAFARPEKATEPYPNWDLTTLAYGVLIGIGLLLPSIKSFKAGEVEIELIEASEKVKTSLENVSGLLQNWMFTLGFVVSELTKASDIETADRIYLNMVRDVFGDLKREITRDEGSVRIALWLLDPERGDLAFTWSNEIRDELTTAKRWAPREGFIGQAFAEGRIWNEAKATELPSFEKIYPYVPYKALVAVPVTLHETKLGMVTVDKTIDEEFGDRSQDLVVGCARMIAIATSEYYRTVGGL